MLPFRKLRLTSLKKNQFNKNCSPVCCHHPESHARQAMMEKNVFEHAFRNKDGDRFISSDRVLGIQCESPLTR
jgi:hypothetical protein